MKITQGEDSRRAYADGAQTSGKTLYRHFCGVCGSHLWCSYRADTGLTTVDEKTGTIEEEKEKEDLGAAVFYSAIEIGRAHV